MTQFVDVVALGWVENNLREEVETARDSLRRYQREPEEQQHLVNAQRSIHSATGALRLCTLDPVALLADEIERVLGLLRKGEIAGEACKSAMTELVAAIEAIPAYLADVRAKRKVSPASVAVAVNDLRQFGRRPALPYSLFFDPELPAGAAISTVREVASEGAVKAFAREAVRISLECSQHALKRDPRALERLREMASEASVLLAGTPLEPYYKCFWGLIELLEKGQLKPDEAVLEVLKHSFKTLKQLSTVAPSAIDSSGLETTIKRILYYLGKQTSPSERHAELLSAFRITDVNTYATGTESRMIQEDDLLDALGQTLQQLKEVMAFLSSPSEEVSSRNSQLVDRVIPSLQQVSLQLHVVGLPELAARVNEQYKILRHSAQQEQPAHQADLVDFGGVLSAVRDTLEFKLQHGLFAEGDTATLDLDAALTEQVTYRLREMKGHINREFARRELAHLTALEPDQLDISIAGLRPIFKAARLVGESDLLAAAEHWEDTRFPTADTLLVIANKLLAELGDQDYAGSACGDLEQILAVLGILDSKQAECKVLRQCADYLMRSIALGGLINDDSMQCFAQAIAALEQFMESRVADPQGDPGAHLRRAQSLAAGLEGYSSQRGNRQNPDANVFEFSSWSSRGSQELWEEPVPETPTVAAVPGDTAVESGGGDQQAPAGPVSADSPAPGDVPWLDALAVWASAEIVREPAPEPEGPDAEIDRELLECFAEEAGDYFKRLQEKAPAFSADPGSKTAIADIRVVFHTMKGTARTIGLKSIGDFMHDMEMVFNALRDGYISGTPQIAEFVTRVATRLPHFAGLIERRVPLLDADFEIPHTIATAIAEKQFSDSFALPLGSLAAAAGQTDGALHSHAQSQEHRHDQHPDQNPDASEQAIEEIPIVYGPSIWAELAAAQVMQCVEKQLETAGVDANRTELEQARELARAVFPALLEQRDGGFLEPACENVSLFLQLGSIEQLASGGIYGIVEAQDGEQTRVSLSETATDALQDYLDSIQTTSSMVLLHRKAVALLCRALSLETYAGEEVPGDAQVPDNVVALRSPLASGDAVEAVVEDIDDELLDLFIETMDEYNESIEASMSGLKGGDGGALRGLKNTLHTVKGAANSIGLRQLGALVHDIESDILDLEHKGNILAKPSLAAIDALIDSYSMAARFVRQRKADWDEQLAAQPVPEASPAATPAPEGDVAPAEPTAEGKRDSLRVETQRIDRLLDIGLDISMSNVRSRQSLEAATQDRTAVQSLARRVLSLVDQLSLQLDIEIQAKTEAMPEGEQFDPLEMDRMTEKQGLAAILREAAYDLQEESRDLGLHLNNALREAQSVGRLLQTNQSDLRQLRLVNLSRLGPGLRRLVHQTGRQLGKQVEFEFDCGKGGLDIRLFEQIRVALEHMLRNAIDHGIGTPEERRKQNKPEYGSIKLTIKRIGSEFIIRLVDDGKGMDPDALRARAVKLGLLGAEDTLSDADALRLVLQAGFSTAAQVTDISGRGVGMDVVYQSINQAGGTLQIQSKPGFFTQFDMRVPASIMVNEALLATLGSEQIAIPLTSLKGSEFHRRETVHRAATDPHGRLRFRGEQYEIRYLGAVRGTLPMPELEAMPDFVPVLYAQHNRRRVAFFADGLDTAEDMVIRSLGAQYTGVPGIAGGAVKSDGQPVLALDLNEFIGQVDHADQLVGAEAGNKDDVPLILCVDDSVLMRRTYEKRLESLGYTVVTAVDGEEALDYLSQAVRIPDFIFTDLEMPNMNGFDFIANLRRAPKWSHIPSIVVSSRDGDKHRAEAHRVGASGFMAKGSNSAEAMQAMIKRHLNAVPATMAS